VLVHLLYPGLLGNIVIPLLESVFQGLYTFDKTLFPDAVLVCCLEKCGCPAEIFFRTIGSIAANCFSEIDELGTWVEKGLDLRAGIGD